MYSISIYVVLFSFIPFFFFFNDTATTEIYTLSLHDALPIPTCGCSRRSSCRTRRPRRTRSDRKSTRLNSSHRTISYAVFCLKKKKKHKYDILYIKKKIKKTTKIIKY